MARNENNRTTVFTCLAMVSLIAVGVSFWMNRPPKLDGFELIGKPFFEEFTESSQATSLKVVAMNDDAELQEFSVEQVDGLWTIPSHYNYPAEAVRRLATTSSSVIGLEREALAGRLESDFERFGVVDPTSEDATDPESVGQRLTLLDDDGEVLADYIIGKEIENIPRDDTEFEERVDPKPYYYVRRADENQTFRVQLQVDLSTKFSDWIEPDLLKIESNQLVKVFLDNYEVQERAGDVLGQTKQLLKEQGEQITFQRPDGTSDWQLEGLKTPQETLNLQRLTEITDVIDNIEIVGVRPKMTFMGKQMLTPDLGLNRDPEFEKDPQGFGRALSDLQYEMSEKGFTLLPVEKDGKTSFDFYCLQGELSAGTDEGVLYTLMFGNVVKGGNEEIEIGKKPKDKDTDSDEASEEGAEEGDADDSEAEDTDGGDSDTADSDAADSEETPDRENRYLMIQVNLDESLLGTPPERPTEVTPPVQPDGYTPAKTEPDEDEGEEDKPDPKTDDEEGDDDPEDPDSAPKPEDSDAGDEEESKERDPAFIEYEMQLAAYEESKVDYEIQLSRYEDDLKAWQEKVKAGEKRVKELHERFNQWYYVISADNLDAVQAERKEFVVLTDPPKPLPERPEINFPNVDFPMQEKQDDEPGKDQFEKPAEEPSEEPAEEPAENSTEKPDSDN